MSALDEDGLLNVDTVENTIVTRDEYSIKYLLGLLNSKLVSWYCYIFIFNKAVRTMDFDGYYVGKIPVLPVNNELVETLVTTSKRLRILVAQLAKIDIGFHHFIDDYPRIKDGQLKDYYNLTAHAEKKVAIDPLLRGVVVNIVSKFDGQWLVLFADYETETHYSANQGEILRIRITDRYVGEFLSAAINSVEKKKWSGNIFNSILSVSIPKFKNNMTENLELVRKIGKEFSFSAEEYRKIASEIEKLERQINEAIYNFYELDATEIALIENMFGGESVVLSLFPTLREGPSA